MFKIGEMVVNGNRGVFQVEAVGPLSMEHVDGGKQYYTLRSVWKSSQTAYIPVDSEKCPLRRVISREQTLDLIDRLPEIGTLGVVSEKDREQRYKESMERHQCEDWIRMLNTLYRRVQERKRRGKRVTSMDERYLHTARKCLLEEFSASLSVSVEEVEEMLKMRMQNGEKKQ